MSIGNGLLTSEDEFWLRQRRIAQPAFHRQRIEALAGMMAETARDTADRWDTLAADGQPVDVAEEMMPREPREIQRFRVSRSFSRQMNSIN
jgi:cytochrome P450